MGLSPVPFYSSAAPSEDSPTGKCKYTGKTHICKCSNLLCEKKKIRHAHFFLWTNVGTSSACIPSRQGRHLRGGVCTPQVFWVQAGRKLSADQTALPKSDPHLTFLHLNKKHSQTQNSSFIGFNTDATGHPALEPYCMLPLHSMCSSMSINRKQRYLTLCNQSRDVQ